MEKGRATNYNRPDEGSHPSGSPQASLETTGGQVTSVSATGSSGHGKECDEEANTGPQAVSLVYRHIFGATAEVKNAVHFVVQGVVAYPAGHHVVLYSTETRTQKFLPGSDESLGCTCLAISTNRRFLAVGERCTQRALVTIHDLLTNKRKKSLAFVECISNSFVSLAFSADTKMLLALGGPPDWCLVYWAWEKPKVLASYKINGPSKIRYCECSFNPLDSNVVCMIGDGVSRLMKLQEGGFRPMQNHLLKREGQGYSCHAWLADGNIVAGTEAGELVLFDNGGDFRGSLTCAPGAKRSVLCIVPTSKGFICGGEDATLHMYEKTDDDQYKTSMELKVEHQNPGLDVCELKPLIVTCGEDRSIRVWDFLKNTMELCKFYSEEVYSVAFHPSGFHILAGFSDKLRLMNLLLDDLTTMREFIIKGCRECRFSNGGHLFAAVHSNLIQVYETYTCRSLVTLRGHNSKVRSLCWSPDDSILVSTGMDGAVYEFSVMKEGLRLSDWVYKGINFSSAVVRRGDEEAVNTLFVVGSDNSLKVVSNSQLVNTYDAGSTLSSLALPRTTRALFAGTADPGAPGQLRSYAFPLTGEYLRYQCHAGPVQRICVSKDERLVISCGIDGTLCICGIVDKDRAVDDEEELTGPTVYTDEVLVTRTQVRERKAQMTELERQVEDLTNQMDFQLRNRETQHKEQLLQLEERYNHELELERNKYDILREEKQEQEQEFMDQERVREDKHAATVQQMETNFQNKMTIEVARYHKVLSERERDNAAWEERLKQVTEDFSAKLAQMTAEFESSKKASRDELASLREQQDLAFKTHQELLRQIEEDADREIEELKEAYEEKLAHENAEKVRLRGQTGIHRKRHEDLKEQTELLKEELKHKEEASQRYRTDIDKLLTDREIVLKEIQERDRTIGDKEQRVYELKKQNQELEKFKFVLGHKIRELKAMIDPKDKTIADMQRQIQAMDAELVDYHRQNKLANLELGQLKLKQRALQDEIVDRRQQLAIAEQQMKRMKNDLYECVQNIQDPKKRKEAITRLYQKYITNELAKNDVDFDILKEQNRQRDYLEKSVESLKRRLAKDSEVHRQDNIKIMQENASLICEINDLRREVNLLRLERQESRVPGASRNSLKSRKKADTGRQPGEATQGPNTHEELAKTVEMQRKQIELLTAQNDALQHKLNQKQTRYLPPKPQNHPPRRASKTEEKKLPQRIPSFSKKPPDSERGSPRTSQRQVTKPSPNYSEATKEAVTPPKRRPSSSKRPTSSPESSVSHEIGTEPESARIENASETNVNEAGPDPCGLRRDAHRLDGATNKRTPEEAETESLPAYTQEEGEQEKPGEQNQTRSGVNEHGLDETNGDTRPLEAPVEEQEAQPSDCSEPAQNNDGEEKVGDVFSDPSAEKSAHEMEEAR
ncbi:putative WD domain, G-beta repeat-containing protein [Neospora caninum Liverpool]|uniref:Putative WD domain, G-beta repeat-containing protein n=1 Tax=Neospora caninum (strain Liverpool) TaxID=572307 RepID=F0VBE6_NEOCL|nr:putative WD domain, G-beta repeat-containing protein [Neospora caninum Liverpool]CBZ50930.1 putative WD domain, G-beta repeat-containing protein [Neospora caninum Liverpool]CEL68231.1 TPA: WD domain, G-beta repeat-containing protein,putative [Neospora caninum Liverpool]|eukprot:XP_003880963.1 putative WD domain, G-beta repeat-containing protein [Neospora caninum Liverpool]